MDFALLIGLQTQMDDNTGRLSHECDLNIWALKSGEFCPADHKNGESELKAPQWPQAPPLVCRQGRPVALRLQEQPRLPASEEGKPSALQPQELNCAKQALPRASRHWDSEQGGTGGAQGWRRRLSTRAGALSCWRLAPRVPWKPLSCRTLS